MIHNNPHEKEVPQMLKQPSGIYHQKLKFIFMLLAAVVTLVLASVSGIFLSQHWEESYISSITLSRTILEEKSAASLKEISNTMTDIVNDSLIKDWSVSEGTQDFYLLSSQAQKALLKYAGAVDTRFQVYLILNNGQIDFDDHTHSTVLSPEGSFSMSEFLEKKDLAEKDMTDIQDYFDKKMFPYVIPHYDEKGALDSLYYLIKGYKQPRTCIYMADIPISSLVGTATPKNYWISNTDGLFIPSSLDETDVSLFKSLQKEMDRNRKVVKKSGYYVANTRLLSMNWDISYLYDRYSLNAANIFLYLLCVLIIFVLLCAVFYYVANLLYRPLYQVLQPHIKEEAQRYDEFEILNDNLAKMQSLNHSLLATKKTTNALLAQQYYQNLLTDSNGYLAPKEKPYFPDSSRFCVGLICISPDSAHAPDDSSFCQLELYKNLIFQSCVKRKDVVFVKLSMYRCALILMSDSPEHAKSLAAQVMSVYPDAEEEGKYWEEQIVLSSVKQGFENLHRCYQETLKIAEYLPTLPHDKIITHAQIADLDSSTYSYPLSMENRLIQEVTDGQEQALGLFDDLIRENLVHKRLSMEVLQNFVYALIGTVNRVFQELKTTPEEFIGRPIDYEHWYTHWADSVTITGIKTVLSEIIREKNRRTHTQDKAVLSRMLDYIHRNYRDNIMLNDLADQFNISPKYCGILFKQLSDNNFKDYLNNYRINQAKALLEKDPSLKTKDLSAMTGFNSSNTFIRVFSKYTGLTPQKYAEYVMEKK